MIAVNKRLIQLLQVALLLIVTSAAYGQDELPKPRSDSEFIDLVQSRLKQVDHLSELDDATKAKIKELYTQAVGEMEAATKWAETIGQNEKLASNAPQELERVKNTLATLPAQPATLPTNTSLTQIEQTISDQEAELVKLRKALADDEAALKGGASRRTKTSEQIGVAKQRLVGIQKRLPSPAADGENPAMYAARQSLFEAQKRTAEREIACCEMELKAYDARVELLPQRCDLNARKVALKEQEIKQGQELANGRRKQEAEQQARQASREESQALPGVKQLLEQNAELAEKRKTLAVHIVECSGQLEKINQQLSTLKEQYQSVQEKVNTVGLTNEMGEMLRKKRETLAGFRECCRNVGSRQQMIGKGQLEQLESRDIRFTLSDLDLRTKAELEKLSSTPQDGDRKQLERAIREALETKRDYLDDLIADHDIYYKKLVMLKNAEQELIKATEDYARFIDERVLWIASSGVFGLVDLQHLGEATWWLAGPETWLGVGQVLADDMQQNRMLWALAFGVFALLVLRRRWFRTRIEQIGQQTARGNCYRFLPTMEATALTVLISAAWPSLIWYIGWRLTETAGVYSSLGHGLSETARVFLALELLRNICRRGGLGESHFHWSVSALNLIRKNLKWFTLPVLPLIYIAVVMAWHDNNLWDPSLGRIAFIAALLGFTFVLHRIFRPASVVSQTMIATRPGGWLDRFKYVWYPLIAMAPLALAVLATVGYHYTARQLVIRLILTAYVIVGGIVCRALLLRWTLVNQRKLAIEQARQRRAAAQCENVSGDDVIAVLPTPTSPDRDLTSINIQTRQMIGYSLAVACALMVWCVWSDVLPALNILNRIEVWPTIAVLDNTIAADGKVLSASGELSEGLRLTLANIGFALLVLATTVIAAKNIPGLLEMAVLQHLPFDAGARYAVATVCRYLITLVGIMTCFGSLGIGWDKVQWLVAAMSLGLGFGLQEIFANFISGLIILIERPIRVGDIITVDEISGIVSRIRMRATTVTDWDRKELVIPNKEFITGRVLNWTLSDPINRVMVNVGVAYGTDTQKVTEILAKVAQENPIVLNDPPPRVTMESFGASSLDFVLRCYLPNLDNRLTTIHELHIAVDLAFREAGIEIAFPQQDVHVRSIEVPTSAVQATMAAGTSRRSSEKAA